MLKISRGDAWRPALVATLALGTLSCGDGGGAPPPTPTPSPVVNSPPAISTADQDLSVAENGTGVLFAVAASDADGDTVRFSLVGDDASKFAVNSAGEVRFQASPDYDLPVDSNRDNTYSFSVRASDGTATDTLDAVVRVTNLREGIAVTRIANGFVEPTAMDWHAPSRGLIVAERTGVIYSVDGATGALAPIADQPFMAPGIEIIDVAVNISAGGVADMVVMKRYPNGIGLERPNRGSEFEASLANGAPEGASGVVAFGEYGQIFAAVGDPSGSRAQGDSGYGRFFVPGGSGASMRSIPIRAVGYGVRQPGGLLMVGDYFWLGDQGGSEEQEISFFLPDQRPINFNWPFFEGTVELAAGGAAQPIQPSVAYPFGSGNWQGEGIVFGRNYTGSIASLAGKFVFGDRNGAIYAIDTALVDNGFLHRTDEIERRTEDFVPDVGTIDQVVSIRADRSGVLYILDADGELFRVDPA